MVDIQVATPPSAQNLDLSTLAAIGMWSDRDDLTDSESWVRQEREQWACGTRILGEGTFSAAVLTLSPGFAGERAG